MPRRFPVWPFSSSHQNGIGNGPALFFSQGLVPPWDYLVKKCGGLHSRHTHQEENIGWPKKEKNQPPIPKQKKQGAYQYRGVRLA